MSIYDRNHYHFQRQQSRKLQELTWETSEAKPLTPWNKLILRGLGVVIVAAIIIKIGF